MMMSRHSGWVESYLHLEKTVTVALEGLQPYRLYVIIVISNWRVLWYSNVLRVNVCHLLYRTNHYLSAKQSVNMQGRQVAFNKSTLPYSLQCIFNSVYIFYLIMLFSGKTFTFLYQQMQVWKPIKSHFYSFILFLF